MSRLEFPDYLRHLRSESARFREVLSSCPADEQVPGCPAWKAADLAWHLTCVQNFWSTVIETRPASPGTADENEGQTRPEAYADLLAAHESAAARLSDLLGAADPADEAWTWSQEQTVGFTYRRQAHEALIHRVDAEQAAGTSSPIDPALAADGVDEVLGVMYGGAPAWGEFSPLEHYVRLDLTDAGESVWVQLGHFYGTNPDSGESYHEEDDIRVVGDPGVEPDAVIEGPAGAVNLWLWRRGDDAEIKVHGDRRVYDHFRAAVHHPLN
ncbi:MAG: maleylpyruvate isomerase family mycothiol-dependent enzyme [Nocardioides sp.]